MSSFAALRPGSPRSALPGRRVRTALGILGLVAGAILLGVFGGRLAISHYGTALIALLVGIPVFLYLAPRPLVIAAMLLAVMSVIGYGEIPRIPVPGHPPVNVADGLLALMVGGTLWRHRWPHWPRNARRFALAVVVLLVLAALPTVRLLFQGHDAGRQAILGYKDIVFVAVGITVAVECNGRMWRPLLDFAVIFAVLVALLSIAAGLSSGLAHVLDSLDAASVQQGGAATGGATRIRLPGLFFAYSMIFPTIALAIVVKDRWRIARTLAVIPMLVAVAISFNRNMYFGLVAGLGVAFVMGGPRLRHRALTIGITLAMVIAIVVQTAILPAATAKVAQRATSGLSTQVLQTSSLQDRGDGICEFLDALVEHRDVSAANRDDVDAPHNPAPAHRLIVEQRRLVLAPDEGDITVVSLRMVGEGGDDVRERILGFSRAAPLFERLRFEHCRALLRSAHDRTERPIQDGDGSEWSGHGRRMKPREVVAEAVAHARFQSCVQADAADQPVDCGDPLARHR